MWRLGKNRVTPKELGVSYDGNVLMSGDAAMSTGGSWYVSDFAINARI